MRAQGGLTRCETVAERAARIAATEQVRYVLEYGASESELLGARATLAALNAPKPKPALQGVLPLVLP